MSKQRAGTSNKLVQTTIHCFPHVLSKDNLAKVSCDRSCQTAATTTPSTENLKFYALLEFIPYQVIAEDSIKELDLPRRALLQWKLPTLNEDEENRVASIEVSKNPEQEDSDLRQKGVLKKTSDSSSLISFTRFLPLHHIMQKSVVEQEVQTDLMVGPHVLDTDELANVYTNLSIQTSITCVPNESISNILPQLQANLSHVSDVHEISSIKSQAETTAEISSLDTQPSMPSTKSDINIEDANVGIEPPNSSEIMENQPKEKSQIVQKNENAKDPRAVTVTVSATKVTSTRSCHCRGQLINAIASKMRVQASTLKLTPKVFPTSVKFEDRIMEVLNTTVAILQTEMARLMEMYAEDTICMLTSQNEDALVQDSQQNQPKLCQCTNSKQLQSNEENMLEISNKNNDFSMLPNAQKVITEISTTRQIIDPDTMKSTLVKENVIEEKIQTVSLNTNNERILEEKIVRKSTFKENFMKSKSSESCSFETENTTTNISTQFNNDEPQDIGTDKFIKYTIYEMIDSIVPITHESSKSLPEVMQTDQEVAPTDATSFLNEYSSNAEENEQPQIDVLSDHRENKRLNNIECISTQFNNDEPQDIGTDKLIKYTMSEMIDNIVPITHESSESLPEVMQTDQEVSPTDATSFLNEYSSNAEENEQPQIDVLGDHRENKRLNNIECECCPTEAGAAPPSFPLNDSSSTVEEVLHIESLLNNDAVESSAARTSSDKTIKFEFLLKKNLKAVESTSAESAIVVRATISNPNTRKKPKENVQTTPSLPDLREQVIRLSVIYKSGTAESEIRTEELSTPDHEIQITANKSSSSCVGKKSLSSCFQIDNTTLKKDNASTALSCCFGTSVQRNVQNPHIVLYNKVTNQTEEVRFSMPCPSRPPKSTGCVASCHPSSRKNSRSPPPLPPPPSTVHLRKNCICLPSCCPSSQCHPPSTSPPPPSSNVTSADKAKEVDVEIVIAVNFGDKKCQDKEATLNFTYQDDAAYEEPYMESLAEDTSTGVQTDLTLGDKLESESLNSVFREEDDGQCSSKTEMPWAKISLPPAGSYGIKPIKKEAAGMQKCDSKTCQINSQAAKEGDGLKDAARQSDAAEEAEEAEEIPKEGQEESGGEEGAATTEEAAEDETEATLITVDEAGGDETDEGATTENEGKANGNEVTQNNQAKERPPPAEPADPEFEGYKPKQKLLFEDTVNKHNEPYMEGLYRVFPNSDDEDGDCGSRTEMPWKDIILPINCKIRKMKKSKKCLCRSYSKNLAGMFIPSNTPPKKVEGDDDDILELHTGFDEPASGIISVEHGAAETQHSISVCSTVSNIHQSAKRSPKEFTLLLDLEKGSNYSISFQTGRQVGKHVPPSFVIHSTDSQPFEVSTKQESQITSSSFIDSIKPSTDTSTSEAKLSGGFDIGATSLTLKSVSGDVYSSAGTNISKMSERTAKTTSSMPSIPSQKSVRTTISLKRVGDPDTKSCSSAREQQQLPPYKACQCKEKAKLETSKQEEVPSSAINREEVPSPAIKQEEVPTPGICSCTDKIKLDTFKQDPVMAALEAYEAEMKPLRQALTELQQKIRNLNMPEMKGCMCTLTLNDAQQQPQNESLAPTTVKSKVEFGTDINAVTRTTMRIAPQYPSGPNTCAYFQPPAFRPPIVQPLPYGYLPPPIMPPYRQSYPPQPNYMASNSSRFGSSCYCSQEQNNTRYEGHYASHKDYGAFRSKRDKECGSCRNRGNLYPKNDICMQARHFGMYPDYRGRTYPDERVAYDDAYNSRHRESNRRKCKVRNVVSFHSSGDLTDYDSSPGTSDESQYYVESRPKRCCKNRESKYASRSNNFDEIYAPSKDNSSSGYHLRPGQAVKTGPDEFLSSKYTMSRRSYGSNTFPKIVSKSKIQVKVPYR